LANKVKTWLSAVIIKMLLKNGDSVIPSRGPPSDPSLVMAWNGQFSWVSNEELENKDDYTRRFLNYDALDY
jgi:hypothetical protein